MPKPPVFYSLSEWLSAYPEVLYGFDPDEFVCPDCQGSGFKVCDECGSVISCDRCHGNHNIAPTPIIELYNSQLKHDHYLWKKVFGDQS